MAKPLLQIVAETAPASGIADDDYDDEAFPTKEAEATRFIASASARKGKGAALVTGMADASHSYRCRTCVFGRIGCCIVVSIVSLLLLSCTFTNKCAKRFIAEWTQILTGNSTVTNISSVTSESAVKEFKLEQAPQRTYHIFTISPTGVGSTVTWNLIAALFEGIDVSFSYLECKGGVINCAHSHGARKGVELNRTVVTKSHSLDVDGLTGRYGHLFDRVFFIGKNRKEKNRMVPAEYCSSDSYPNVMCIEYEDMLYNDEKELRAVVRFVRTQIQEAFPYFQYAPLLEEAAVQRLLAMAAAMKDSPGGFAHQRSPLAVKYGAGGGNFLSHTLEPDNNTTSQMKESNSPLKL